MSFASKHFLYQVRLCCVKTVALGYQVIHDQYRATQAAVLTSVVPEVAAFQFTSTRPLLIAADILLRLMPMPALATESRRSDASTVLT